MLNRKSAADHAVKHLIEFVPVTGSPVVEEHFLTDGIWQITLSYFSAGHAGHNGNAGAKEFKTFTIDGRSGEVLAMKIRSIAT